MTPKPTKISQRKKLRITKNIENLKEKLKLINEEIIIFREIDFSDKFESAVLVFITDWHLGAKYLNIEEIISVLEYVLNTPNAILIGLGDNLNTNILNSVGNMYEDVGYPQHQLDTAIDLFAQAAAQGKIVIYLDGNHERRVYKATGLSLGKHITKCINSEDSYGPHFGAGNIILKAPESPNGIFNFRLTTHHGDGVNFLKMQNLNPGAVLKLVGHWHRYEMIDEIVTLPNEENEQFLFNVKNIKLPNAGKTDFEATHLEKSLSPYFAIEISSTKNPHFIPNSKKRLKYPEFIPTMRSIPILNLASNKKKNKVINEIKDIISKKQVEYVRKFKNEVNNALKILEEANLDLKEEAISALKNVYKPKDSKDRDRGKE